MTVVSKQTLLDYFCSGGRATHSTSTLEYELEDLIDTLFDVEDQVDVLGDKIDGFHGPGLGANNFAVPVYGYDYTDQAAEFYGLSGLYLQDIKWTYGRGVWRVPANYIGGDITFKAMVRVASTGNILCNYAGYINRCDEGFNAAAWTASWESVAVTGSKNNCIREMTASSLQAGDFVSLKFERDGAAQHAGTDDCGHCYLIGFSISY